MKKFFTCLLIATITSCTNHEKSSNDENEIDINEARAVCEKLDNKYENIYKDWLRRNNIKYKNTEEGLIFEYQNGTFCIAENSDDREYFRIIMPNVMEIEDDWSKQILALLQINKEYKCVKCFVSNGNIWLSTEILLDQTPEIEVIMPRLLSMLHGARSALYSKI